MFYYNDKLPLCDSVVVAVVDHSAETDSCVYVHLPEFNNCRGVLYKNELPKKLKKMKEALKEMKQATYLVCSVSANATLSPEGVPELVDLSVKSVAPTHHEKIIKRFKNIEKIYKLVKFISNESGQKFDQLVLPLQENLIASIDIADDFDNDFDDLDEVYYNYLRNPEKLSREIGVQDIEMVVNVVKSRTREQNASSNLEFYACVWGVDKDGRHSVYVLQDLFKATIEWMKEYKLAIRYIGSPKYQLVLSDVPVDGIDEIYEKIRTFMTEYLNTLEVKGCDIKFNINDKVIDRGVITISYPVEIVL